MPYQGTNRQVELKTLHDELAFTQKRLHKTSAPGDKRVLLCYISQIRKDILRYGGEI